MADRHRWANPANYKTGWLARSRMAGALIPDNISLLEIGAGTGGFRGLVAGRTRYLGADLEPLDSTLLRLNLDADPLPSGPFDYAVLLGVFSYLERCEHVAESLASVAANIVVSYGCRRPDWTSERAAPKRAQRGWINDFDRSAFVSLFTTHGLALAQTLLVEPQEDFEQMLFLFQQPDTQSPA